MTGALEKLRVWKLKERGQFVELSGHVSVVTCLQFNKTGDTMFR